MSEKEEYLDELLRDMDSSLAEKEGKTTEEGILNNYDKEMEEIDEDEFLREFEKSLGDDLDSDMETEFLSSNRSSNDLEQELGLADDSMSMDFMDNIDQIVNNVKTGNLDETFGDGDLSIEESLKNFEEEDPDLDGIGQEFAMEDSYMVNTLDEADEVQEPVGENELTGMEELSEAERLAREIEGLNLEAEDDKSSTKAAKNENTEEVNGSQEKDMKKEKKGFFARLSTILFGEDEEEIAEKVAIPLNPEDLENLSEENLEALMNLESQKAAEAEAEEKKRQEEEEKKALKEQKAKEKAEKKAEKKALKDQKAKEKAQKKAMKQMNQEPVEKSKPLPKKPVALIILFGLSIVILVNLLSNLVGYNTAISDAEDYYAHGEYVEAYGCLYEKDVKDADLDLYNRIKLAAYLQQQWESYEAYQSQNMYSEALGSLICCVGRYDRFIDEAVKAGVDKEYDKMFQKIEEALSSQYQMSIEEARTIYAIDDKQDFTYAVYDVISELGLNEVVDEEL